MAHRCRSEAVHTNRGGKDRARRPWIATPQERLAMTAGVGLRRHSTDTRGSATPYSTSIPTFTKTKIVAINSTNACTGA